MKNDDKSFKYLIEKINKYSNTKNKDILIFNDTNLVKNQRYIYQLKITE